LTINTFADRLNEFYTLSKQLSTYVRKYEYMVTYSIVAMLFTVNISVALVTNLALPSSHPHYNSWLHC